MLNVVEAGRAALKQYRSTKQMPVFPEDLTENDISVWSCIFEDDLEVWKELQIERNRRLAATSVKGYLDTLNVLEKFEIAKDSFLDITGMLANSSLRLYSTETLNPSAKFFDAFNEVRPKIASVWLAAFDKIGIASEFLDKLQKAIGRHRNFQVESADEITKAVRDAIWTFQSSDLKPTAADLVKRATTAAAMLKQTGWEREDFAKALIELLNE